MRIIKFSSWVTMVTLFLSGCASTTLTSVWNDENYKNKPIQSIMVIGVLDNTRNRNIFETEMAAALEKAGVHAITSSKLLGDKKISKENVLQAVTKKHIQTILVTRLVGIKKQKVYHPPISHGMPVPYYRTWDGFYPHMYAFSYSPGYTATYTSVIVETNIFAVKDRNLIWSASSETFEPKDVNKEIKQFSEILVRKLKEGKLVK